MPVGRGGKEAVTHRLYPWTFCTLPSFARIMRPKWLPVWLNDRHRQSHGKIGDCEQSKLTAVQKRVPLNMRLRTLLILWKVFNQLLSEDTMKRAWEHVFQGLIWVQFQLGKSICSQIWKAINDFCRNIQLIILNLAWTSCGYLRKRHKENLWSEKRNGTLTLFPLIGGLAFVWKASCKAFKRFSYPFKASDIRLTIWVNSFFIGLF